MWPLFGVDLAAHLITAECSLFLYLSNYAPTESGQDPLTAAPGNYLGARCGPTRDPHSSSTSMHFTVISIPFAGFVGSTFGDMQNFP